jgi:ABC-2 type transport system ATP-binding protein
MSRGTRQKLALVLAWMHRPDLLLLDEPTGGLDPLHQQTFYALVGEARAGGATVFLSSHDLAEVEHVCDRAGIVRAGRLVAVLGLGELRGLRARRVEIAFAGPPPAGAVRAAAGVESVEGAGNRLSCTVRGGFDPLLRAIAGHTVLALDSREPSLEELFLAYYQDQGHLQDAAGGPDAGGAPAAGRSEVPEPGGP